MMSVAATPSLVSVWLSRYACDSATLVTRISAELRGHRQPQRDQIVGVVQVVELGRMDDLRLAVERAIVTKVQVSEVTKLVERNDVGDFRGVRAGCGFCPRVPGVRHDSIRRARRTVLGQPEMSF